MFSGSVWGASDAADVRCSRSDFRGVRSGPDKSAVCKELDWKHPALCHDSLKGNEESVEIIIR